MEELNSPTRCSIPFCRSPLRPAPSHSSSSLDSEFLTTPHWGAAGFEDFAPVLDLGTKQMDVPPPTLGSRFLQLQLHEQGDVSSLRVADRSAENMSPGMTHRRCNPEIQVRRKRMVKEDGLAETVPLSGASWMGKVRISYQTREQRRAHSRWPGTQTMQPCGLSLKGTRP